MWADQRGSRLRIGRTNSGCVVRVEGRGTLRESPAIQEFALHFLEQEQERGVFVIDLAGCDYLDSTFLGFLVLLHGRYNRTEPHRFLVAASDDQCQRLLAPSRLNRLARYHRAESRPCGRAAGIPRPRTRCARPGQARHGVPSSACGAGGAGAIRLPGHCRPAGWRTERDRACGWPIRPGMSSWKASSRECSPCYRPCQLLGRPAQRTKDREADPWACREIHRFAPGHIVAHQRGGRRRCSVCQR